MNAYGGDADILKLFGQGDNRFVVLVVAETCLDSNGQRGVSHQRCGDSQKFRYVFQHARTGTFACYLANGAAPIDVDKIGLSLGNDIDAAQKRILVAAKDLYAYGSLKIPEQHLAHALFGIAYKSFGSDELANEQVGPMPFAELSERHIGHIVHRRENQREITCLYAAYFNHLQ